MNPGPVRDTYLGAAIWDVLGDRLELVFEAFWVIICLPTRHQDSMTHDGEEDGIDDGHCRNEGLDHCVMSLKLLSGKAIYK